MGGKQQVTGQQPSAFSSQLSASEGATPASFSRPQPRRKDAYSRLLSTTPDLAPTTSDTPLRSPIPRPSAEIGQSQHPPSYTILQRCWRRLKLTPFATGWSDHTSPPEGRFC